MLKKLVLPAILVGVGLVIGVTIGNQGIANSESPVKLRNLLHEDLASADDLEVIVSLVEIGPGLELPKHYHPGEEFIYVLEGSAILWQKGKEDVLLSAGEAAKVPLEQVHTAITQEEPVKALVFRVHKKGQPERIPAE